ncbi:MAG: MBL fold metallo-hydrolase, partial [Nocardioidaceae bacterium]
ADLGPFRVSGRLVDHPVEAYAIKVEYAGRTLVYSGDTAACPELTGFTRGADLFLAEAAFRDGDQNPPHLHMTGSEAARTAAEAGASRLVLTHVAPWHDPQAALAEADGVFDGEISLATVGATYDI